MSRAASSGNTLYSMYTCIEILKGNCNQNLHLVFIDLIQSTTSVTNIVIF